MPDYTYLMSMFYTRITYFFIIQFSFILFSLLPLHFLRAVFRAGEQGRFWYAVLGGSLEVRYHAHSDADGKVSAPT